MHHVLAHQGRLRRLLVLGSLGAFDCYDRCIEMAMFQGEVFRCRHARATVEANKARGAVMARMLISLREAAVPLGIDCLLKDAKVNRRQNSSVSPQGARR